MNKCLLAIIVILGLTSCMPRNEHYYQTHPEAMQQAMTLCPDQQPRGLTCQQLGELAARMNNLAYQLQLSPQGFGNKILALQETIATQQKQLEADHLNSVLRDSIKQNQRDLQAHLAVVKWLESPAS